MAIKKILLDTSAYSKFILNYPPLTEIITTAQRVFMSSVVIGELYSGFIRGTKEKSNKKLLHEFLNEDFVTVVPVSSDTAIFYSQILATLRKEGKPIPTNDIWIAACAMETASTLITLDRHFSAIPNLLQLHP
jgi:tRNA(fMet)-specific endonuclease VapC